MSLAHLAALVFLGLTRPSMTARLKVVKQHSTVHAHKTAEPPTAEELDEAKSVTSENDKVMAAVIEAWNMFQDEDGKMTLDGAKKHVAGMLTGLKQEELYKFYDLLFQPDAPEGLSFVEFAKRWIALHRGDAEWTQWQVPAKYTWFSFLHEIPEDAPPLPSDPVGGDKRADKFAENKLCWRAWRTFVCNAEDTGVENIDAHSACNQCAQLWCGTTRANKMEEQIEKCKKADLSKKFPWHALIPEP